MTWMNLSEAASLAGGRLIGADAAVESVTTDTRALTAGQLFVALVGPHFDGHEFVGKATAAGAAGAMVARRVEVALPQVLVDDTLPALQRMAAAWRARLALPMVALTGSNGKTTVKEMITAILGREGKVLATKGNLNNHIGVPLTLLSIRTAHAYAVIELGANHAGEIAALTALTRPGIALITNAAAAHLEGFGSIEGVAKAKGEIFQGLPAGGIAVINADDGYADYWRGLNSKRRSLTFGLDKAADVRGRYLGDQILHISTPVGEAEVNLPLPGRHNARNALAAAAVAVAAGTGMDSIKAGLESVPAVCGRLVLRETSQGACLLDDSYNANPASLAAGLEVLAARAGEHWLALGDMAELGAQGDALHRQAGEQARAAGVVRLYTLGRLSRAAAAAFGPGARHFEAHAALADALRGELHAGVSLLIKGSRSMRMERVVEALAADGAPRAPGARQDHAA